MMGGLPQDSRGRLKVGIHHEASAPRVGDNLLGPVYPALGWAGRKKVPRFWRDYPTPSRERGGVPLAEALRSHKARGELQCACGSH